MFAFWQLSSSPSDRVCLSFEECAVFAVYTYARKNDNEDLLPASSDTNHASPMLSRVVRKTVGSTAAAEITHPQC